MVEMQPLGDNLLVKQTDAMSTSAGGIVIPGQAQKKPKEANVVAVGPGRLLESGERLPMQVEVGDHIVFAHFAGQVVEIEDEEYLLLKQEEVVARIRGV